jgi:hypothetical protein
MYKDWLQQLDRYNNDKHWLWFVRNTLDMYGFTDLWLYPDSVNLNFVIKRQVQHGMAIPSGHPKFDYIATSRKYLPGKTISTYVRSPIIEQPWKHPCTHRLHGITVIVSSGNRECVCIVIRKTWNMNILLYSFVHYTYLRQSSIHTYM